MSSIKVTQSESRISLQHPKVELHVDVPLGVWSLKGIDGKTLLGEAGFRVDHRGNGTWPEPDADRGAEVEEIEGAWGRGVCVTLIHRPKVGYAPISRIYISIFNDQNFIELDWSIENQRAHPVRVKDVEVLHRGKLFPDGELEHPQHLEGGAGAQPNQVTKGEHFECLNNVLLTAKQDGERISLVAGGLAYEDYFRGIEVINGEKLWNGRGLPVVKGEEGRFLTIYSEDPNGYEISPGEIYRPGDSSYLDLMTSDPFDALEKYGEALASANQADPNVYHFPTLCGWMVSTKSLGEGKPINHSTALIEQAKIAQERGWMKVAPLGVRLEPDYYCWVDGGNTQQGWWDDERFKKYGALSDEAPTFEAFCKGLEEYGAIPFTYVQASMPSNDFALAHPNWMLNGDIADLHRQHNHHRPHVRYDLSHPDLQEHLLKVWRRLGKAGLKGIKFDYPETAWNTKGGYSENITTTRAYRKLYEICKEGLGKDSYVHERNLGGITHENAPCLDVTAGTVDLQRVWGDASHFEPEMASKMGLRWYKCRRVFHYYPDGKSFYKEGEALPALQRRSFLTIIGLLGGRIEIGTSIGSMDEEMFQDLAKLYPPLGGKRSFRPVDFLVSSEHPEVYLYEVSPDWHQVMLYNSQEEEREVSSNISGDSIEEGGLGLEAGESYHAYAFWSEKYLGLLKGSEVLSLKLKGGEAEVISLRKEKGYPQLVSTDRHVMQGMLECHDLDWDGKIFSGKVDLPEDMPVTLMISSANFKIEDVECDADTVVKTTDLGLCQIRFSKAKGGRVPFSINFKNN